MFSDISVVTGFGLIAPILAIFIKDNLVGGTIFAAGLASTIFFITKSIIQLPFSRYVDKHDDNVKWLLLGTFLIGLVPFLYIFANSVIHIYIAQILYGIGSGLAYPTWLDLWSLNLDKDHESFEWSVYSTLVSLGAAITATIGAAISEFFGFTVTFVFVGILSLLGCFILIGLGQKKEKSPRLSIKNYQKRPLKKGL